MKRIAYIIIASVVALASAFTLEAKKKAAEPRLKVACVGNSITYGYGTPDPSTDSYPAQLKTMIDTTRYEVRNFGKSRATLVEGTYFPYASQPEHDAAIAFAPDVVVIHLGVNDTDPRVWPDHRDDFIAHYLRLIDRFRTANPNVRVIIANASPLTVAHGRYKSSTMDWRYQVREAIATVAEITESELIDFETALIDHQNTITDAVHPNKRGLGYLAEMVAKALTGNYGGLQMSPLYADGMVLQRHRTINIAGQADAGTVVTVELRGQTAKATADNRGNWNVELGPFEASTGNTLTIKNSKKTLTFNDVAIGEVWVASGQSNMAFRVSQAVGGRAAAGASADPMLRFFDMKPRWDTDYRQWNDTALVEVNELRYYYPTTWREADSLSTMRMSAVAYWFAKSLRDNMPDVPVGVVLNAIGGAPAESFIEPGKLMDKNPDVMLRWRKNDYLQPWVQKRAGENAPFEKDPFQRHPYEPTYLYSAGVRPLENYTVEGVIWYQGESNAHNIDLHAKLFPLVVESFRDAFNDPNLPFYIVQLSSIQRLSWPEFRNSQRLLAEEMNGVEMAVSSDLGDSLDVHPRHKQLVGERLGRIALAKLYGKDVVWHGPKPISAAVGADGRVVLTMDGPDGLKTSDGKAVRTFEVAHFDGHYYPATATITGPSTIVLESPEVKEPRYVRYGWQPFTRANLVNNSDIPTSTFKIKTDFDDMKAKITPLEGTPSAEKGIEKGISAMYGATTDNAIVIAGGCNFPADDPIAPTATKQYYKGVYAYNPAAPGEGWKKVAELPEAAAYGATFVNGNEMLLIGGTTEKGNMTDIVKLVFPAKGGKPQVKVAGKLPFAIDNPGFCSAMGKGFIAGGNIDGKPSNRVVVYDFATGEFSDLPAMPGNPRVQPVAAVADGKLYVWGGFAPKHDGKEATLELGGLVYDFTSGKWSEVAGPATAAGEAVSVGGGCAAAFAGGKVMVCGGVNKDVFLNALRNQAPDYLQHPIEWYAFNPNVLMFDAATGQWSDLGASAECARAGALLLNCGADSALLFGGELKPRVRTPQSVVVSF